MCKRTRWLLAALLIAAVALAPVLALAWAGAQVRSGLWQHLLATVLPQAAGNTVLLLAGVGLLVGVVGTGCAWLVTAYEFPGRRLLSWALLLPLAVPTYIVAYAYLDLLHPLGPVQGALRWLLGHDSPRDWRLPDIRHLAGCIVQRFPDYWELISGKAGNVFVTLEPEKTTQLDFGAQWKGERAQAWASAYVGQVQDGKAQRAGGD